jgi:putative ABC transport system permease protein
MPVVGRLIEPDDVDLVAVLSHALWERRFGGDPMVIGRRILIEGQPFTIIGVTRSTFRGLGVGEDGLVVTVPMPARAVSSAGAVSGTVDVLGRLKSGVTLEQAQAQLESFWPKLLATTVPSTSIEAQRIALHTVR